MSERVLCRPGPHAPPGARLAPGGKAYILNRDREYWVDAGLAREHDYWVPVEPMPDPPEAPVSDSDGDESEPNPYPSQQVPADEAGSQSVTAALVCGAPKSNGEPCQRAVDDPQDHCWQHEE